MSYQYDISNIFIFVTESPKTKNDSHENLDIQN